MNAYVVRRSRLSLWIGYLLAEILLVALLAGMLIIWRDEPSYLDWPVAIASWVAAALFFHVLLFTGTFYSVRVDGESIEYRAFLRKAKKLGFSDIQRAEPSIGVDVKIIGQNNKRLFYVKQTDRNFDQFMADVSTHAGR